MKSESIRKAKPEQSTEKNNSPVQAGKSYSLSVTGLGHSGEGVGRIQDFTVFVPNALPGETIEVLIKEVKRTYARGKVLRVISPAPERCQPLCAVYDQCGGCQLQHLEYPAQLAAKRQIVLDSITRIGKLTGVTVHPTLGAEFPWYYRNKMQSPVGLSDGGLAVGCFAQGTHDIIDSSSCHIQHQTNNLIAATVKRIIADLGISVYNEKLHQGAIRHVLGRVGTATGEVMVVLVTATRELPQAAEVISRLRQAIPGLVSIVHNVNDRRTNIILGEYTKTIWGQDTITDCLDGLSFRISAKSFFQVNTEQAAVLYRKVVEYAFGNQRSQTVQKCPDARQPEEAREDSTFTGYGKHAPGGVIAQPSALQRPSVGGIPLAGATQMGAYQRSALSGRETVFDLYCGTGTIALFLARHCQKVIGIEIVAPAIADARKNAELNGITNAEFHCGDTVELLPKLADAGIRPDVIVIDPPRAGCERKVLDSMVALQPERIVYVSCNPASLARDLAILDEQGYLTQEIQPVDLFPQTFHVETITLLQRRNT